MEKYIYMVEYSYSNLSPADWHSIHVAWLSFEKLQEYLQGEFGLSEWDEWPTLDCHRVWRTSHSLDIGDLNLRKLWRIVEVPITE